MFITINATDGSEGLRPAPDALAAPSLSITTASPGESLDALQRNAADAVLLHLDPAAGNAADFVAIVRGIAPDVPVVLLADNPDAETVGTLLAAGAADCLRAGECQPALVARVLEHAVERRRLEGQLAQSRQTEEHLAYYDSLSGLPNRRLFFDRLDQVLSRANRQEAVAGLMMVDLDGFKHINKVFGLATGDRIITAVGERLNGLVRQSDTVARIGGDEFAIILNTIRRSRDAANVARKILESIAEPVMVDGQEFTLTASIGIALFPEDGGSSESLAKAVDIALFRAKGQGRNNFQFYNLALDALTFERLEMEQHLHRALENHELSLQYQPIVAGKSRQVVALEALLRWKHPDLGEVPPHKFIPVAEESGLIVPIGDWVIRTACEQNKALQKAGYEPVRVWVNLSARQFREKRLPVTIMKALGESELDARYLGLEITESNAMDDVEFTIKWLKIFKDLGVSIAIDDFGTGYSSLGYLKRFPLNTIKIDRSFVHGVPGSRDDIAIVSAITALSRKLDLNVIAEGVETSEQATYLSSIACDAMQGFFFSRPVAFDALSRLLVRRAFPARVAAVS